MRDVFNMFNNKTVVSVYCDSSNPDKHLTGWIYASSEDVVMIQHISPRGLYDGFILVQRDDIYRVDADGNYERKISNLYQIKRQKHPVLFVDDLYTSLLEFCKRQELIISVELKDEILSGFVSEFDDEYISLVLVDDFGDSNGHSRVVNNEIISIAADTEYEQDIRILYKLKNEENLLSL